MLKKTLFCLIVSYIALSPIEAETDVHFLLFGGYSNSRLVPNLKDFETIKVDFMNQYHFGAGFRFEFGKTFYLQPEVYFTHRGGMLDGIFNRADTVFQKTKYLCVDIPMMLGFRMFNSENFCLRLYGGPVLSLTQDPSSEFAWNQIVPFVRERSRIFSAQAGLGFDFWFMTLDFRYHWDITESYSIEQIQMKNQGFLISLGFKLF